MPDKGSYVLSHNITHKSSACVISFKVSNHLMKQDGVS